MIGPLQIAAFAAGFVAAGSLSAAGGWAYNTWIENPGIVRVTRATCASDAASAAAAASLAQWRKNQERIDTLTADFNRILQQTQSQQDQVTRELENDIATFEAGGGSQCSVSIDNLDFLRP